MRPTVRVGLAGCGRIAERGYLPALKRTRGVSLAAVADPVIERCHALAPGVASYRDPAALVRAGGIDALVVASPPAKHVDHARLGAEAGLAVLVEKPPASDLTGAAALAALRPAPHVGFNRRFWSGIERLRLRWIPGSAIECRCAVPGDWAAWEVTIGALADHAIHHVDLVSYLSSEEPRRVRAERLSADVAELELELESCRARVSVAPHPAYSERVEVRAPDGSVRSTGLPPGLARRLLDREMRTTPLVRSLRAQIRALAAAVAGEEAAPLATARDGVRAMAVMAAAERSAAERHRWTAVE